jgi:aminopeptidase N
MRTLLCLVVLSGLAWAVAPPSIEEILGDRPYMGEPMSSACRTRYDGAADAESLHSYNVRHYRVDLNLPMVNRAYSGRSSISIRSEVPAVLVCTLDFVNLVCDSAKRLGVPLLFTTPTGLLAVELDNPLPLGDSTVLDIFFHRESTAPERGYYFAKQGMTNYAYAMTCTPPKDCRYWMPCWDEPFDKPERGVMLNLTVPDTFQTCANGLLDSVTSGPGTKTYWWNHPYPIATYLVTFAASRFATWQHVIPVQNDDTVRSDYYMYPFDSAGSVTTFNKIPDIMTYFSDSVRFGPYPFEKYGMVPGYYGFPWGGMENQTMVMIHTQWLRSGDNAGMAHELSHMWYGDMVTCVDFRNVWLNEGFGTFAECNYMGHLNGRAYFQSYMLGKARSFFSQDRSRRFAMYDPPEAEIYNYGNIYCKGAWVLHMLRYVVGDTAWEQPGVFFRALRAYGDSFKYGCASTADYERINEQVTGLDLGWFFEDWVYQAGYPKYHLNWSAEPVGDSFRVVTTLAQINGTGAPDYFRMPLPVRFNCLYVDTTVTIRPEANPAVDTFMITACPDSITIDPDNWVLDSAYVTAGIEEREKSEERRVKGGATVIRGVLNLQSAIYNLQSEIALLDVTGRKVLDLKSGANDVSSLSPGVYFAREPSAVGGERSAVHKVIVQR